jgi:hypothetical protein
MKQTQNNANKLTNPMRRIVYSLILTYAGYAFLGFVITLMLATLFSESPQPLPEDVLDNWEEWEALTLSPDETEHEDFDIVPVRIGASLLTFALYAASVYNIGWQYGMRDRNVVKCGYAEYDGRRGLIAGAFAQIPSAALLLALWVLEPLGVDVRPWFGLFHFAYSWILEAPSALFALILPIMPLLVHFGFCNGYKDVSLRRKIMYANPEKARKKREKRFR